MSRDFRPYFFGLKDSTCPYEYAKTVSRKFFVYAKIFAKIREKNVWPRSRRLRWHGVSMVVDYPDTMSVLSLTTLTLCPRGRLLRRHHVIIVNNYADTVLVYSQRLCTVNYFTLEKDIRRTKVAKSWEKYVRKAFYTYRYFDTKYLEYHLLIKYK